MKIIRALPLLLAVTALTAVGCKNDTVSPPGDTANRPTLLIRTWRTTEARVAGEDALALVARLTTFKADGTYDAVYANGTTEPGTWALIQGNTKLSMDEGSASEAVVWDILELTSTKLRMKADGTIFGTMEYTGVPE